MTGFFQEYKFPLKYTACLRRQVTLSRIVLHLELEPKQAISCGVFGLCVQHSVHGSNNIFCYTMRLLNRNGVVWNWLQKNDNS
jgi:hypothetical protein